MEHAQAVLSILLGSLGIWLIQEDPEDWLGWFDFGMACYILDRSLRDIRIIRALARRIAEQENNVT